MAMNINGIKAYGMEPIKPITQPVQEGVNTNTTEKPQKSFGDMFSDAIKTVDGLQQTADIKSQDMIRGADGITPHEAMIALEKADTAFQLMNAIRGKIIRAYEDIMRTQV